MMLLPFEGQHIIALDRTCSHNKKQEGFSPVRRLFQDTSKHRTMARPQGRYAPAKLVKILAVTPEPYVS
jgi:phosphoribosylaminoimidazole (AIR) synthetase